MSTILENATIKAKTAIRKLVLNDNTIIGGQQAMPFVKRDGQIPHSPKIAVEIHFKKPDKYPPQLETSWEGLIDKPVECALKAKELGADIIALRMDGINIENNDINENIENLVTLAKDINTKTNLPLCILGINNRDADKKFLPLIAEKLSDLSCLIGPVEEETYKDIVPALKENNHSVIARTPIDVNLAKQLNILITEIGIEADKIIMDPNMGGLGYGLDYAYSVVEKIRLAAYEGDQMLNMPIVVFSGEEAWRSKEAKSSINDEFWGNPEDRAAMWEILSTSSMIMAGADMVIMKYPPAISEIAKLTGRAK